VNGDAMFAIAIRSLFVSGNRAFSRSGSGIVYDSVCEREYEEVLNKQKAMTEAIRRAVTHLGV
jgi:anthranilate synthase component 1